MPATADQRLRNHFGILAFHRIVGRLRDDQMPELEDWHEIGATDEPAFENSWASAFFPPGFYRDPLGIVRLRGFMAGTTLNTVAFTLPDGYRPEQVAFFNVARGGGSGGALLQVHTDGTVTPVASAGTAAQGVALDGVAFRAAD